MADCGTHHHIYMSIMYEYVYTMSTCTLWQIVGLIREAARGIAVAHDTQGGPYPLPLPYEASHPTHTG